MSEYYILGASSRRGWYCHRKVFFIFLH